MEELHRRAAFTVGLDPDTQSLREHRAPRVVPRTCGLAEALPCADEVFDVVCSSWVMEHLSRPKDAFAETVRVLKPAGQFIFLTPNVRHPLLFLNRALRWTQGRLVDRLYDRAEPDIFPVFYRANSSEQIRRLARSAGYKRVSVRFVADPTYVAFNEPLFRLSCVLERLIPRWMRVHLVGVCTKT